MSRFFGAFNLLLDFLSLKQLAKATALPVTSLILSNAGPASLPAGCSERDNSRSRAGVDPLWGGSSGRVAWGFRDFSHLPAAKENRNGSRRTLALFSDIGKG
jgi:hypothetical protein